MFEAFLVQWTYFGSGLCFFYVILELIKRNSQHYTLALLMFMTGNILLRYGWYFDGWLLKDARYFLFLHTSVTLAGPLLYVFISRRLREMQSQTSEPKVVYRDGFHFIPAALIFIGEILFFFQDAAQIKATIDSSLYQAQFDLLHIVTLIASIHISFYCFWCLYLYHKISSQFEIYELQLVWIVLLLPVVANCLIGPAYFFKNNFWFKVGSAFISMMVMGIYVIQVRYPGFLNEVASVIRSAKYQNTPLEQVEIERANRGLKKAMTEDHLFRDSDLRLVDLAAMLGLSVHQTSRYLNEVHQVNFYELINEYRIKEACHLLKTKPLEKIIDIGYEVGFNSKSTFNSQFMKITGMSPAQFRKT